MATSRRADRLTPTVRRLLALRKKVRRAGRWLVDHPALLAILCGLGAVHGWFVFNLAFSTYLTGLSLIFLWNLAERHGRYRYGFLFALAYFLPITNWLGVFVGRWTGSPVLYGLAWGFVALGLTLPLALIVPIAHRLLKGRAWPCITLVWLALEVFRSYVPVLAFPWGLLAHPFAGGRGGLEGARFYGGEYGFGAIIVLGSLLLRKARLDTDRAFGSTIAWTCGAGVIFLVLTRLFPGPKPDLTLAAYGPGLDLAYGPYAEGSPGRNLEVARRIAAAREEQGRLGADLMVMPEGLVSSASLADLTGMDGPGTFLLGGQRRAGGTAYQTAFAIDGVTGRWQSADKTRLVIFGEFVPGRGVIPYPPSFALPGGDLSAASELRILDVHARDGRLFRVGPILCFEALFPDIAYRQKLKGAEVLAVMSLDDWFGGTKAPEWLELASRWRAAETGLPLVRVGSLGRTAIVDGRGKVRRALPWGESGALAWNPARE